MIPGAFDYHRPSTVDEAVKLLADLGDEARVLAGGHSLIPMMKLRMALPENLIDLQDIAELQGISEAGGTITIGAMVRQSEIIGSALLALGEHDAAEQSYCRALALDPESTEAQHGLAITLLRQKRYEDAAAASLQAVGLRHFFPEAHFHLGAEHAQCIEMCVEAAAADHVAAWRGQLQLGGAREHRAGQQYRSSDARG